MTIISSVLGPLDTSELGFTLTHEHIVVSSAGIQKVYPEFIDREATIQQAVSQLKLAHSEGVRSIIDVTTLDLGRDMGMMAEVSRASGVNIVCATGIWRDVPRAFWTASPDIIASLFIREIQEGIEDSGIRAGIIKVANHIGGVTPEGEIMLRAAARAQQATGVPISTHTYAPERVGDQQVRIFEEEGVDLNRVYIGHSNDTADMDYLLGLLEKGVWLGLDRYPGSGPDVPGWESRTETAYKLMEAGFGDRLMMSHDRSLTPPFSVVNRQTLDGRHQQQPDDFLYITRNVLPKLREIGATDDAINQIMIDNPRRFFEGVN